MNTLVPDSASTIQRHQHVNPPCRSSHQVVLAAAFTLASALLWLLMHRYRGIDNDAQVYAFQALARLHPDLLTDLYLQNDSQDRYTVFSPIYAWFIRLFGLDRASLYLTIFFIASFLVSAWVVAYRVVGRNLSWLAICALIIIPGAYGGAGVFHYSDNYLTARLCAQGLIASALACHFCGSRGFSALLAFAAMLVHPLMALPGALLLLSLSAPIRLSLLGAILGVLAALAIALLSANVAAFARQLPTMDTAWLAVVHERSHFLFLQYWKLSDWNVNAKPFIGLSISALVLDAPARRFAVAAIIVGGAGIVVALVPSYVAPVAILVEGQAWRWVWVTVFVCVLLLAPTAVELWRDKRVGPLGAVLLVLAWTFAPVDGTQCLLVALALWLGRFYVTDRTAGYLRWAALAVGIAALSWTVANSWTTLTTLPPDSGHEPVLLTRLRNVFGLETSVVLTMGLLWHWLNTCRSEYRLALAAGALLAGCVYVAPKSFNEMFRGPTGSELEQFSEWRDAIPPASTVLIADKYDPGSFVWFTLLRPNYLAINQSAGVVFSRATALEVQRRSEILLPLMDQDWKLFSKIQAAHSGGKQKEPPFRPLTAANLRSVCADMALGFVVAKENVGFSPIPHSGSGVWQGWNLYDCRRVRTESQRS